MRGRRSGTGTTKGSDTAAGGRTAKSSRPGADRWQRLNEAVAMLDLGQDALLCLDAAGRVSVSNRGAEQIFDRSRSEMIGRDWREMLIETETGSFDALLGQLAPNGDGRRRTLALADGAFRGKRGDATTFPVEGSVSLLWLDPPIGYALLLRDISARVENEMRLRYLSQHDDLTGLPNRSVFMDRLESAVSRHRRSGRSFSLLFLDIDDFKAINDRHGHDVGDIALREFAARLRITLRSSDTVARIGGDEFAVILEQTAGPDEARQSRERIRRAVEADPVVAGGAVVEIRSSIGIAEFPREADEAAALLRAADKAMYASKRGRKQEPEE